MKKILLTLIIMTIIVFPISVNAKEKTLTIYMFESNTCIHCEQALEYIQEHLDEIPENVEIMTYEVSENSNNAKLMNAVAEYLEVDTTSNFGTPFFVIGSEYNKGYTPGDWENLFEIANDYIENDNYEDTVMQVIDNENLEVEARALEDALNLPNPVVTIVVYCVFGAIVLGFIALMIFSRK